MTRDIRAVVIHCSASPNGDAKVNRDTIDGWHRAKGWQGIGYHYVVEVDGLVDVGRTEDQIGAHVAGSNAKSIGVCVVGTDKFTSAQWESLADLCNDLAARYPAAEFAGHRDYSPDLDGDGIVQPWEWFKTCPGFDVRAWRLSGMNPLWNPDHVYVAPATPPQAGFGTVQVVAVVAVLGILAALAFAAKSYLADVDRRAHDRGVAEERGRWQNREVAELTKANQTIAFLNAAYQRLQAAHAAQVNSISAAHQEDLRHARTTFDADVAAIRAGDLRLRDPGGTPGGEAAAGRPAAGGPAAAGGPDAARGTELSSAAAEFLFGEAGRADALVAKVGRLQALVQSYYQNCGREAAPPAGAWDPADVVLVSR